MQTTTLNPIFKWPGGKRFLIPLIRPIWERHQDLTFCEAFAGGMAMTLGLNPAKAILNDINPHVINFYNQVKQDIQITLKPRNQKDSYYRYRDRFNKLIASETFRTEEGANYFYVISKMCFNSVIRFNKSGLFNTPFGDRTNLNIVRDFAAYKQRFNQWRFYEGSYDELEINDNMFLMLDPPYDCDFVQYSQNGFTWADQVRVAEWAYEHKGPMMLCNQATTRTVALYKKMNFKLQYVMAPRRVSCDGNRKKVREVIATRNI